MPEGPGKAPERVGRVPRLVELPSGRPRDAPRTPGRLWGLARQGSLGGREGGISVKAIIPKKTKSEVLSSNFKVISV